MANIFEKNLNRKVPKNLSKCVETDATAKMLFVAANKIENLAKFTTSITAIIGFIASIYVCVLTEDAFLLFLGWAITAIISYLIYYPQHLSAAQMSAFATIVDNTTASTNMQMYYYSKKLNEEIVIPNPTESIVPTPIEANTMPTPPSNNKKKDNDASPIETTPLKQTNDVYITVSCPNCHESLEFSSDTINAICPYCDTEFKI